MIGEAMSKGTYTGSRKRWSRKLTPAQIRVVAQRYHAGSNTREIMQEFGIGRTSLYRYLQDYEATPDVTNDATHWRIEYERVKDLAVELALANKTANARIIELEAQLT